MSSAEITRCSRSTRRPGRKSGRIATEGTPTNRGFNYWESKDRSDRRIIFASRSYLQQLDATNRQPIATFGVNGLVNLREGLGRTPVPTGGAQSGSPGQVFENLLVLGSAPGEGYNSPPGDLRAFDVLTGKLRVDIPHHSSSGRVRLRHVAARCMEDRRRRQYVGRVRDRREARHRVFPAGLADIRFVGRRSKREQPVRQLRCWRSTFAPASGCGTTSFCITICGTTTSSPGRSC